MIHTQRIAADNGIDTLLLRSTSTELAGGEPVATAGFEPA
jgi:hypothetical protein